MKIGTKKVLFKSFKDMPIWQETMNIAVEIFKFTEKFPKKEDYGLTSQMRRSAVSISANIAEAYGRHHTSDKINFYYFARGSVTEVQNHLEYAKRVGYLDQNSMSKFDNTLKRIYNDINKIIISLNSKR